MPVSKPKTVSKAQKPSKKAMKAEAMATPSSNEALKREALQEPARSPERAGASYGRIKGTRKVVDERGGQRSGVITSIPVTTNWEAIESVFASRQVQTKIRRGTGHDGEMG